LADDEVIELNEESDLPHLVLNHTKGKLTLAVLARLWARSPKAKTAIPDDMKRYLMQAAFDNSGSGVLAKGALVSRIHWIHAVDPLWANENLANLLDPNEIGLSAAEHYWDCFFWIARYDRELMNALRSGFIGVITRHESSKSDLAKKLFDLWAEVNVELPNLFQTSENKQIANRLSVATAQSVLFRFELRLENSAEKARHLWAEIIGPFIEKFWPSKLTIITGATSSTMVSVLLKTREEFCNALRTVVQKGLLCPVSQMNDTFQILNRERDIYDYINDHPIAVLELLSLIIGEGTGSWYMEDLKIALAGIAKADPRLDDDVRFRRLFDLSNRA
jgi:hypothetical protein